MHSSLDASDYDVEPTPCPCCLGVLCGVLYGVCVLFARQCCELRRTVTAGTCCEWWLVLHVASCVVGSCWC